MAEEYGRKWDRCLADTGVKTVLGLGVGLCSPSSSLSDAHGPLHLVQEWALAWDTQTASTTSEPSTWFTTLRLRNSNQTHCPSVCFVTAACFKILLSGLCAVTRLALPGAVMWQSIQICGALFVLLARSRAAPPPAHINRLALFPDKSAWCEAKDITQIVGHTGCQPRSIQNRACLGQCFSYSVPNTFPQSTESLIHCDSCMPAQTQWEVVTLDCPDNEDTPHVDKLVERIFHCSCQSADFHGNTLRKDVRCGRGPGRWLWGGGERGGDLDRGGVKMLPPPVAHSGGSAWGSRRGRCGCMAWGVLLVMWNLCIVVTCALLLALVFAVVLLPAMLLLYAGFLCHSRVLDARAAICQYLDDNSCSALIILGFVMMSPLVVVAAAVFCGLLRKFRLLFCIQPISRAWYRGRLLDWATTVHAWV
ncbi:hypothetical protein WMY93_012428 [Mugilogobius chulae]|uniref:CTCK domain-containing protein n=1 Tax=Mugilogobius chulae TaxID=88201 RepID=A0AAW0P8Y5_9GOBI